MSPSSISGTTSATSVAVSRSAVSLDASAAPVSSASVLEVDRAGLAQAGVVEVGGSAAFDRAVALVGFAGVGHRNLFLVIERCGGTGDQPKTAITPLAKSRSRPATSATMNATKTMTTVV